MALLSTCWSAYPNPCACSMHARLRRQINLHCSPAAVPLAHASYSPVPNCFQAHPHSPSPCKHVAPNLTSQMQAWLAYHPTTSSALHLCLAPNSSAYQHPYSSFSLYHPSPAALPLLQHARERQHIRKPSHTMTIAPCSPLFA